MVPQCILRILEQDPEIPDVYSFKFTHNHPILENLRVEFVHTEKSEDYISTASRFFWKNSNSTVLNKVYRLKNAYDPEGNLRSEILIGIDQYTCI